MKRLFICLLCALFVMLPAAAYADGGNVMQIYGWGQNESSLDVLLYTRDEQYFSAENYSVTFNGVQLPVNRLQPLSSSGEYGTSWAVVVEPAAYESISGMAETLIEALVSGFGEKDNAAVINAVTGEMTEFIRDKTTLMPFVRTALSGKGDVRIYDSLRLAYAAFTNNMALNARKCILLITEGIDNSSMYTLSEARDEAVRQAVTVYTVGITRNVSTYADAFKDVSSLSRATPSGIAFSYDDFPTTSAEDAFNRITEQEKNNYVLSADLSILSVDSTPNANVGVTFTGADGNKKYNETIPNVRVDFSSVTEHAHVWEEATCQKPQICTICGKIGEGPVDHQYGADGVCIWCGQEQSFAEWVKANWILCAATAGVLLLIIIMLIVIISMKKKKRRAAEEAQKQQIPADEDNPVGKVTVELTNKESGEKFRGEIRDSTLKAGRSAELSLPGDPSISREHMEFIWQNGILYVQDTNARNGTWVNGTRLQGAIPLHQSDMIHAGDSDFIVNWYSNR